MDSLISDLIKTSLPEWIAVVTGILYVLFISYQKRIGWLFAFISTLIYTYLCILGKLYIEASLQLFYVFAAIYGWIKWSDTKGSTLTIQQWSLKKHRLFLLLGSGSCIFLGFTINSLTDQASPYLDAFTTVFSLIATFMVAKKVLENWWYWIVIDAGLIFLYSSRGYALTGLQYGLFTLLALYGWITWQREYKSQAES